MLEDMSALCRVCMNSAAADSAYNLYTERNSKMNAFYADMIAECTNIKPHQSDGLPPLICKNCSRQLKRTYAFNALCVASDRKLRLMLAKLSDGDKIFLEDGVKVDIDIKQEEGGVKVDDIKEEVNSDVKTEPNASYQFEDGWDAEDDELLLSRVRSKELEGGAEDEREKECKPKKRGRKRKGDLTPSDSKLPHQCDICGKFLSTKSNLKAHKICHTDLRPYKCSDCPASFRGYSALFQHKKVHSGETPYHCEYCPKQFSRRTGLVNHVRVHTGEKLYSCEICFKNFTQSAQLSIHMKRHKGDKSFLCQDCGKGFPIKSDLKVHQRIHNGEKPYSCHLCTKTFATSGNLSIHVRIHNKEIRYHCKECSRGFVTCSAFNVHVKRHKGQRDYQCECGKTFYTSSALKQHKVVHTGEKKYQCKVCERKFSQTSHLSRHFKKDHAKPALPAPVADDYKIAAYRHGNPNGKSLFNATHKAPEMHEARNLVRMDGVKCESS